MPSSLMTGSRSWSPRIFMIVSSKKSDQIHGNIIWNRQTGKVASVSLLLFSCSMRTTLTRNFRG